MNKKYLIGLAVIMALPFVYGFTAKYAGLDNEESLNGNQIIITGEQLFQNNCSACHGIDMKGNPPAFPSLVTVNERMEKSQVVELLQTGRNVMPSFAHLTEAERMAIAGYLYGETTETEMVTNVTPTENGNRVFVANCARCHKVTPDGPQPPGQKEWGIQPAILGGITAKYSIADFKNILNAGPCYMPSFNNLSMEDKEGIYVFLGTKGNSTYTDNSAHLQNCNMSCRYRYKN